MPERGEVLLTRRNAGGLTDTRKISTDIARRDLGELESSALGPGEKPLDRVAVGAAGVLVADGGVEEFLGGEDGGAAGAADDVWQLVGDRSERGQPRDRNQRRSMNCGGSPPPSSTAVCLKLC